MAGRKEYEAKAEQLLLPIVEQYDIRIYDVEYVKEGSDYYLRAFIDKDGGVDILDCEKVSREFSDKLDEADFISDAYILEVSSPGLGRSLKKDRHFENSLGEEIEIKLFEAIDGVKEFTGVLKEFDKSSVTIEAADGDMSFDRSKISIARLTIDF